MRGADVITVQRRKNEDFECITADFSNTEEPESIIAEVIESKGRLDVLVNNAGMMMEAPVEEMSIEDWQSNLNVNLTAPFLMIRAALPYLRKTTGNIINTGPVEGIAANPHHAAYCATKAGIHGLTRSVAVDHGREGIRCNAVAPGWIDTELNQDFIDNSSDPDLFRRDIGRIHPVGRTGTPEEVAALVAFLAAEESGFIIGQLYTVDGGRTTQLSLP